MSTDKTRAHYEAMAAEAEDAAINRGGQAFPVHDIGTHGTYGMDLRDYFAAKAMSTLIETMANAAMGGATHPGKNAIAKFAYEYADAMLKAREVQS